MTLSLGPGSHAVRIFRDRYNATACRGCYEVATKMDQLGPDGCDREFDSLVAASVSNSKWPAMITKPIIVDVFRESIDLARKDAVKGAKEFEVQVQEVLEEIQGPFVSHGPNWEINPVVQESHKRLMHAAVNTFSLPEKKFEGKGIVTIAGGTKYFACGYMLIYQLRKLGCKLPIQVWYLGRREMDSIQARLLTELGDVELIDAMEVVGDRARILGGWQLKIWAILESKFEEVLFLDSDNNPIKNPEYLFDDPQYQELGAVLWPDLLNEYGYDIKSTAFELCGLAIPTSSPGSLKPDGYTPVESGQLLFNKPKVWRALQVVKHMNDHSDFWFGGNKENWYFYGDKSTFYLGFNANNTKYFVPRYCEWFGSSEAGGFRQYDLKGQPIFEHRCQPTYKVSLVKPPSSDGLTNPTLFMDAYADLTSKWSGTSWTYQQQSVAAKDVAAQQFGLWYTDGLGMVPLVEFQRGRIRNGMGFRWSMDISDEENPKLILVNGKKFYTLTRNGESWECPQGRLLKGPPKDFQIEHTGIEAAIWGSVMGNEYRIPDSLANQTVLDIGAHVGVFSKLCLDRGAKLVVSVEPCKQNYNRLVNNMRSFGERSVVFNRACWRSDVEDTTLLVSTKTGNSGGFSVVATTDGEDVSTIKLDVLIEAFGPIDLLKIDCESSEWPILLTSKHLNRVARIVGEWHLARIHEELPTLKIPGLPKLPNPLDNEDFYKRFLAKRLGKFGFQINFVDNTEVKLLGLFFAERA